MSYSVSVTATPRASRPRWIRVRLAIASDISAVMLLATSSRNQPVMVVCSRADTATSSTWTSAGPSLFAKAGMHGSGRPHTAVRAAAEPIASARMWVNGSVPVIFSAAGATDLNGISILGKWSFSTHVPRGTQESRQPSKAPAGASRPSHAPCTATSFSITSTSPNSTISAVVCMAVATPWVN